MLILLISSPRLLLMLFLRTLVAAKWGPVRFPVRFRTSLQLKLAIKTIMTTYKIQNLILGIADRRIRSRLNLPVFGADKYIDNQLWNDILCFFDWKSSIVNMDGDYLKFLSEDDEIMRYRNVYFRLSHYLQLQSLSDNADKIASDYKSIFGNSLEALTESDIGKLYTIFRKKHREEFLLFQNSQANLINFSISDLTIFLPIFSVMMVVCGYFHVQLLYRSFGVYPSHFFSINDYLATSIEQLVPGIWSVVSFICGWFHGRRNSTLQALYPKENFRFKKWEFEVHLLRKYGVIFAAVLFLVMIFLEYIPTKLVDMTPLTLVAVWMIVREPVFFISKYYFERPSSAFAVLMAIVMFFSSAYLYTQEEIEDVKKKRREVVVEMRNLQGNYTEIQTNVIGANSRYIFMISDENKVEIIPINNVKSIQLIR